MNKRLSTITRFGALGGAALLLGAAAPAMAAELAWREVSHLTDTHAVTLAETGGHTLGSGKGAGMAFFKDGQVASVTLSYSIDYLKSEGDFIAYESYAFADGSAFSLRRTGRTVTAGGGAEFDGNFIVFGGKGRFADLQGKGRFTGKRVTGLSAGADQYFDYALDTECAPMSAGSPCGPKRRR